MRHIGRLNGEFLLLVESGLWYDLLPSTEGKKIFDLYKDKLDRIEDSDVFGVYGSAFPKYLLCENTQVMKIRKSRKLLAMLTCAQKNVRKNMPGVVALYLFGISEYYGGIRKSSEEYRRSLNANSFLQKKNLHSTRRRRFLCP